MRGGVNGQEESKEKESSQEKEEKISKHFIDLLGAGEELMPAPLYYT